MRKSKGRQRFVVRSTPKSQRLAKREFAVERETVVGKRKPCSFHLTFLGTQQPGCKPKQARFAAAVGAGDLQRVAGCNREAQVLEQKPAAAP
jgi:hypothetical protein